jgi:hypothetical protein
MLHGRAPLLLLLLVAALAVAAGCGSSSSSAGTGSGSSAPTTTPSTSTPASSGGGGSLSGGSSFCGQAKSDVANLERNLAALASISYTPKRLKAEMETIIAAYQKAEGEAPDAIKPDIATVYQAMSKLNQIFAAHNYDPVASEAQAASLFTNAKMKYAFAHLKAWAVANCGGL